MPTYNEFREMVRIAHGGSIRYALILWHNLKRDLLTNLGRPLTASDLPGIAFCMLAYDLPIVAAHVARLSC